MIKKNNNWSRIGLGTGTLASLGRGASQREVCNLLSFCRDTGVNVIDTADSYTSGKCEVMLGIALKARREDHILVSKSGYCYGNLPSPLNFFNPIIKKINQKIGQSQCFDPSYIIHSIERSLQRLKTDYLDCFLLHDPTLDAVSNLDLIDTLEMLKKKGLIKQIGVSTSEVAVAKAAMESELLSVLQTPVNPTAAKKLGPIWLQATGKGIHLMANHVFYSGKYKTTVTPPGMTTHEFLLKKACVYVPHGTILVGTRNVVHLANNITWANTAM